VTVWGVDLGVRGISAAGLREDTLELSVTECLKPKRVSDQPPYMRAMELTSLARAMSNLVKPGDQVFIEEPPAAGAKNLRTFLKLAQVSAAVAVGAIQAHAVVVFVPVSSWKKEVIGNGGASKELIAAWLSQVHPTYYAQCDQDQNRIDATCIALYGRGADPRGVDHQAQRMAIS
jgi:Holliday junction resolvasome RuvABC endonuclease subunit